VKELNLSSSTSLVLRRRLYRPTREEHNPISGTGGSRTRSHEGLNFAAQPSWRTVPYSVPDGI
jgi:hypothetical protein